MTAAQVGTAAVDMWYHMFGTAAFFLIIFGTSLLPFGSSPPVDGNKRAYEFQEPGTKSSCRASYDVVLPFFWDGFFEFLASFSGPFKPLAETHTFPYQDRSLTLRYLSLLGYPTTLRP